MSIGKRIKKLRQEKGFTQKELGDLVNVSPQVISNWERGYTPGIDHDDVLKLADALGTSTDYLLGRTDNPSSTTGDKIDFENYEYQAKTLADALIELSSLHFKYHFDEDMMTKLVRKAVQKYGAPQPVPAADPAAHGPYQPGTGIFDKKKKGKRTGKNGNRDDEAE